MKYMADGLYILASLDGAALSPLDAAAFDLPPDGAIGGEVPCRMASRERGVVHSFTGAMAFHGHLDEAGEVAAALGRPVATPPADLVAAMLARHGDDAPALLLGEWAFSQWDSDSATLTLVVSDTLGDPMHFATDGRRAAVAPHPRMFRRVGWVDASLGPGLLLHMGRSALRDRIGGRTLLRGVHRVKAGTRVTIDRGGIRHSTRRPPAAPERWSGSFDDAIERLDATMRLVIRTQMRRQPASAVMLSGGLDSSLIAAFAGAERTAGDALVAVTSAAPPGSGLPDEIEFSRAVADRVGIAMMPVIPGPGGDPYLPSPETLRWLDGPICSARHYLYDALYRTAAQCGAAAMFDGCDGEMTVSGYPDAGGWRHGLRTALERMRSRRGADVARQDGWAQGFHARLSADALAMAREELGETLRSPTLVDTAHRRGDVWGYSVGITKNLRLDTTSPHPGIRNLLPYRDRRLLRLFAGMPYSFIDHGGMARAPARALLAGKVPEHIRMRPRGRPFSPDYPCRIRRYADTARARLPGYAEAGVGDWLDLAWLDAALARIATGAMVDPLTMSEAQTTTCAAAFLEDWFAGG